MTQECEYCGEEFGGIAPEKALKEHKRAYHGVQAA